MVTVEKIKADIYTLPETEYVKLKKWFTERDWSKWDKKITQDSKDGKLDFLIEEAIHEKNTGTLRNF